MDEKEHLQLPFAGEFSLGYRWKCPVCGNKLRSEKSQKTSFNTWYFTEKDERHYKTKCNLKKVRQREIRKRR